MTVFVVVDAACGWSWRRPNDGLLADEVGGSLMVVVEVGFDLSAEVLSSVAECF